MSDKVMDIKEIMARVPHRYPFLLVDRVVDYEKEKWIKAIKNVTINEPGVLMIEALAQTGGILALLDGKNQDKLAFFMTINNAKFRKPVTPGDQLLLHATVIKRVRQNIVQMHGEASVDGNCVCEADLMFSIADKEK
jgi:3-hydroxyacyl-[acyl-carrier-protein] dehydratase